MVCTITPRHEGELTRVPLHHVFIEPEDSRLATVADVTLTEETINFRVRAHQPTSGIPLFRIIFIIPEMAPVRLTAVPAVSIFPMPRAESQVRYRGGLGNGLPSSVCALLQPTSSCLCHQ